MWCLQRTKFLNLLGDKTCSNSYLSKTTCLKEYESATQDSGEYDYISFFKIQYVNKKVLTFLEDKEHPSFNERNCFFKAVLSHSLSHSFYLTTKWKKTIAYSYNSVEQVERGWVNACTCTIIELI